MSANEVLSEVDDGAALSWMELHRVA
jgi:hypothetical protein